MASVSAKMSMSMEVVEHVDVGNPLVISAAQILHGSKLDFELSDLTSGEPVSAVSSGRVTLTGGAAEIDLTAAKWITPNGGTPITVNLSTKRIRAVRFIGDKDNTAAVVISAGDVNGYELFGPSGRDSIGPKGVTMKRAAAGNFALPLVDATHKTVKFTSTHATAKVEYLLVAG